MNFARCHAGRIGARASAVLAKPRSGTVIAAAIILVTAVLLTASYGFGFDWARTWKTIGFPGIMLPPFYDLYAIAHTAAGCAASGEPYP